MTVAMDAMAVAIHIKYLVGQNEHLTFYCPICEPSSNQSLHHTDRQTDRQTVIPYQYRASLQALLSPSLMDAASPCSSPPLTSSAPWK